MRWHGCAVRCAKKKKHHNTQSIVRAYLSNEIRVDRKPLHMSHFGKSEKRLLKLPSNTRLTILALLAPLDIFLWSYVVNSKRKLALLPLSTCHSLPAAVCLRLITTQILVGCEERVCLQYETYKAEAKRCISMLTSHFASR